MFRSTQVFLWEFSPHKNPGSARGPMGFWSNQPPRAFVGFSHKNPETTKSHFFSYFFRPCRGFWGVKRTHPFQTWIKRGSSSDPQPIFLPNLPKKLLDSGREVEMHEVGILKFVEKNAVHIYRAFLRNHGNWHIPWKSMVGRCIPYWSSH